MARVHRNGKPPRNLLSKTTIQMSDMDFHEETMVSWMRENLSSNVQYDFVVFNGSKGRVNRSITLTVWFQTKKDCQAFREHWCQ